jgi:uncharacterized cupredoxin-like copper-binding protein
MVTSEGDRRNGPRDASGGRRTAIRWTADAERPGTVYVVNADAGPHTFDIELGGRVLSYLVPPHSTTAVVLDLTTAGIFTYWCAIPGHRSSMEGTLEVTQ